MKCIYDYRLAVSGILVSLLAVALALESRLVKRRISLNICVEASSVTERVRVQVRKN